MSVTLTVYRDGIKVDENTFAGKSITLVLDHLNANNIEHKMQNSVEALLHNQEKGGALIIIDDSDVVVEVENIANYVSEYSLIYEEQVYKDLLKLLQ